MRFALPLLALVASCSFDVSNIPVTRDDAGHDGTIGPHADTDGGGPGIAPTDGSANAPDGARVEALDAGGDAGDAAVRTTDASADCSSSTRPDALNWTSVGPLQALGTYDGDYTDRVVGPMIPVTNGKLWMFETNVTSEPKTWPVTVPANYPIAVVEPTSGLASPRFGVTSYLPQIGTTPLPLLSLEPGEDPRYFTMAASSLLPPIAGQTGARAYVVRAVLLRYLSVDLAQLDENGRVLTRRSLFSAPQPRFGRGAVTANGYTYVYATDINTDESDQMPGVRVARVPSGSEDRADAYEVFTGSSGGVSRWSHQLKEGVRVLPQVPNEEVASDELSVAWNEYLQAYVAVYGRTYGTLVLETAPAPEGPWTKRHEQDIKGGTEWGATRIRQHPALAQQCGKRLIISYFNASASDPVYLFSSRGHSAITALDLP